jgi:hypothetical protein
MAVQSSQLTYAAPLMVVQACFTAATICSWRAFTNGA